MHLNTKMWNGDFLIWNTLWVRDQENGKRREPLGFSCRDRCWRNVIWYRSSAFASPHVTWDLHPSHCDRRSFQHQEGKLWFIRNSWMGYGSLATEASTMPCHASALVAAPCPDSFLGPRLGGEDLCLLAVVTLALLQEGLWVAINFRWCEVRTLLVWAGFLSAAAECTSGWPCACVSGPEKRLPCELIVPWVQRVSMLGAGQWFSMSALP